MANFLPMRNICDSSSVLGSNKTYLKRILLNIFFGVVKSVKIITAAHKLMRKLSRFLQLNETVILAHTRTWDPFT